LGTPLIKGSYSKQRPKVKHFLGTQHIYMASSETTRVRDQILALLLVRPQTLEINRQIEFLERDLARLLEVQQQQQQQQQAPAGR
jgi:hypothetical protein